MFYLEDKKFIKEMIKKYPVQTLHIEGRLKDSACEYYVDDKEKTQMCMIKHEGWLAPFSEDPEKMVVWLNEFLKDEKIEFCGLPLNLAGPIIKGLKDYEVDWEEKCVLYYLPQDKYAQYLNIKEDLDSMDEEDVPYVYEHYTYKDEDSVSYLSNCISKGPSTMIKNQLGERISWALLREDGSLGVMYTLEAYRQQGLAMKVSKDLIKKVIKKNHQPYVHIVEDNVASRNLAKQLGMVLFGEILWFGMKKRLL